jgi:hypothetical protein
LREVSGRSVEVAIRIANGHRRLPLAWCRHSATGPNRPVARPATRLAALLACAASVVVASLGAASAAAPSATSAVPAADPVDAHLAALAATLDPRAAATLAAIAGVDRRLLAARSYLRSARTLDSRWSWSAQDLERWQGSDAQRRHDAAIARVACEFAAADPGHSLHVNPRLRTLEEQVAQWNANESVGAAAARFGAAAATATRAPGFPPPGSPAGRAAFERLLVEHAPEPTPTLAAPGLSLHGRMQAVDFHVERDGSSVAAPDAASVATVWRAGGWEARLRAAIDAADVGFVGPLRSPDEPWHYDWTDAASSAASTSPATDGCRIVG